MDNPYEPKSYKITDRWDFTSDTFLLRVSCNLNPEPGQFVEVSVLGVGECPISVCSYSQNYIDLLIRNVGNVTSHLAKMKKGGSLLIRGPYGHGYPMSDMLGKNVAVIAGGTGVAPPRSVLEYVKKHRNEYHDVYLFLGFRDPEEILFKEDLEKWQRDFNLTVSVDKCADPTFTGKVCFVTDAFGDANIPVEGTSVVLCGPPIMMKVAVEKLEVKGFNDKNLYLSFERHMKCGVKKCGHCVVAGKYMCSDGPVFSYDVARGFYD